MGHRTDSTADLTGKNHSLSTPLFSLPGSHCDQELCANWGGEPEDAPAFVGPLSWSDSQGGACQPPSQPLLPSPGASLRASLVPGASQNVTVPPPRSYLSCLSASTSDDEPWEGALCPTVRHRAAPACAKAWRRPCARGRATLRFSAISRWRSRVIECVSC